MYTIKQSVFEGILKQKFRSMVGNICEKIELFAYENKIHSESKEVRVLIDDVKKFSYDSMRDIEGRVEAFSQGANINVKIIRPNSI